MKKLLISLSIFFSIFFASFTFIQAQTNDCSNTQNLNLLGLNQCLADLEKALNLSKAATAPLESQLLSYQKQLGGIKNRVFAIEAELGNKRIKIDKGYEELDKQKESLDEKIVNHYINSYRSCLFCFLLDSSIVDFINNLAYQQAIIDRDKNELIKFALMLSALEEQEKTLQSEQAQLAVLKIDLDKKSADLDKIVGGAKAYQSTLSGQISQLSALQQNILTGKSGTFTTAVGDVPLADDPNAAPTYNPGFSPAFATFSFGAYTHRNGMSQYGAKARADQGQNFRDILSKYYPGKEIKEGHGEPSTITVDGYGNVDFQQYLYGIAEMPSSWNMEALKAQAVAARSYSLAYTNNGTKSICATQSCQVYIGHSKGGAWEEAVKATQGIVVAEGGNPVSTQYSSTTGGYINTSGWDTTDGTKNTWTSGAYEKIAASPWFYKGWYTENYSNSSSKCGKSHPWLSQEEMADILNAYLIKNKSGVDNSRITPITTSCWGGNPYSMGETRDLAASVGGGSVTSISGNPSVVYSNDGTTSSLTFSTNVGSITINGADFKQIFNLRAPGFISIRSPLYNIERK